MGSTPFSCCYYKKDPPAQLVNEWNVTERENSAYGPAGENGGSSMSLLRRIFYYAFLAGRNFWQRNGAPATPLRLERL
ncbi:MAG: hypothetical protein ACLR23_27835 [Clostridia bacterium]